MRDQPEVLIVDHHDLSRHRVARRLAGEELAVTAVGSAEQAAQLCEDFYYDTAVLEIDLSEHHGVVLASFLLATGSVGAVVFYSSSDDDLLHADAMRLGPVIAKTDGIDHLVGCVQQVLGELAPAA